MGNKLRVGPKWSEIALVMKMGEGRVKLKCPPTPPISKCTPLTSINKNNFASRYTPSINSCHVYDFRVCEIDY